MHFSNHKTLIFSLVMGISFSIGHTQVFQSDKELGRCSVKLAEDEFFEDNLERNRKIEKECEVYDDKKQNCELQSKCEWVPQPMFCESNKTDETEAEAEFCSSKTTKEDCLEHRLKCDWGYKKPACNALDQENKEDIEFCENFDNNENTCEKNSDRCDWD